jgi:hypothetical protein
VRDERSQQAEEQTGGKVTPAREVEQGQRFFGALGEALNDDGVLVTHVATDLKGRVRLTFAHSETRTLDPQRKVVVA